MQYLLIAVFVMISQFGFSDNLQRLPQNEEILKLHKNEYIICKCSIRLSNNRVNDTKQPLPKGNAIFCWNDSSKTYSLKYEYSEPPSYRPPGYPGYTEMDFDLNGNLIYWRSTRKYGMFTSDSGKTIEEFEMNLISPDDKILTKTKSLLVNLYDPGKLDPIWRYFQAGASIGFSNNVTSIAKLQTVDANELLFEGIGSYETSPGRWKGVIDPEMGLMRKAYFSPSGGNGVTMVIETTETLTDKGKAVARYGAIDLGSDVVNRKIYTEISSIETSTERPPLFANVSLFLDAPLPKGTQVHDERDGQHKTYSVE